MLKLTKYNYIVPTVLFLWYLLHIGKPFKIELPKPEGEIPKWSAIYLALGHFNYDRGYDLYDFNPGEGWGLLKYIGKPFIVNWNN